MKVHLEPNLLARSVRIWVVDGIAENAVGRILRVEPPDQLRWEEMERGTQPTPTLELPRDVVEALVSAAADITPPSAALAAHLSDSREVRDRMIALVEELTSSSERAA